MACKDCDCGKKEREIAAAKAKQENDDRIVIYDVAEEESGCGGCPSANPIAGEVAWFNDNKDLFSQLYPGKFLVIKNQDLHGSYDTAQAAYEAGVRQFGLTPFAIQQAGFHSEDEDAADKLNEWISVSGLDVVRVNIKKLDNFFALPAYKTSGAAAMDLHSAEDIFAPISAITVVSTGIAIAVPEGYEAQIRPRSGLGVNGVMVANSPGTIDSDYRGEIKVILANFGYVTETVDDKQGWVIKRGDRIAQILIAPVTKAIWAVVTNLDSTDRASGGFGSTGV